MASFGYYALTFLESIPAIVGVRAGYEQPKYTVVDTLTPRIEVRRYEARVAAETAMGERPDEAFGRLFRYITGANHAGSAIAMTVPVERGQGQDIAMTAPVEMTGERTGERAMRFFLPADVAAQGAPAPDDPAVRIVEVAPRTMAAIRFSGLSDRASVARERAALLEAVGKSHWVADGAPVTFNYDPPFTLPPFRRNEVLVPVVAAAAAR